MQSLFRPKLNAWDQLVYDTLNGTVRPEDRVYSPFGDSGLPSANEKLLSDLGKGYTILPKDLRMGEDEVTKLLTQAIAGYQSHSMQKVRRVEEGKWYYDDKLVQNSFSDYLKKATGGKLEVGYSFDREAYDATQGLVKAEREMEAARQRQAEQQARQQAEQQAAAKRAEQQQAQALAEQQKLAAVERAKAEAAKAQAERDRAAAEERTRQQKQYKASTESGNLQSGGDAPTVITGKANSPTTSSDLSIGRGGNRRRGSSLSSVLGLF